MDAKLIQRAQCFEKDVEKKGDKSINNNFNEMKSFWTVNARYFEKNFGQKKKILMTKLMKN